MTVLTDLAERLRGQPRAAASFDRRLIVPMILGSILNPVNSSMLAVALIPIGRAFHAAPAQTAWLVSGLYLATAVGQPVIGRLVDAFGPRPLYLLGTALVGVAGLLGVWAPTLGVLVVSRVLLGFGTSAAYPASMSLLRSEADRTGMSSPSGVLAALSAANQVISVVGPTLGGLLIAAGGWHLIFAVNVPLSAACLVLGSARLPRRTRIPDARRIDVWGMLLFAAMLTAFLLFVMDPGIAHLYLVALALLGAAAFTWRELGAAQPFIDLRVLSGNAPLLATYARQVLTYTTSYSFLYGFTQWLEEGRSLSASAAGIVLLPMSATAIVVTVLTGRKPQIRAKLMVGSLLQVIGCAALLLMGSGSALWTIVVLATVIGVPQGLNGLANQNALYAQADPERMGSSAGLLRTFMYLGALLASAANAAFYRDGATTGGLHDLAGLLIGVAVLFLIVTVTDRSLSRVGR